MREGDVVQRPKKLQTNAFPGLLVLYAQLVDCFDLLRAVEADVLTMLLQEMKQNHLAQTIIGSSVRHA